MSFLKLIKNNFLSIRPTLNLGKGFLYNSNYFIYVPVHAYFVSTSTTLYSEDTGGIHK